jgi:hypothetical protein
MAFGFLSVCADDELWKQGLREISFGELDNIEAQPGRRLP